MPAVEMPLELEDCRPPVNERATRMASSVDSVPEPVNFTCSAEGTSRLTSSAQRTSSSCPAP